MMARVVAEGKLRRGGLRFLGCGRRDARAAGRREEQHEHGGEDRRADADPERRRDRERERLVDRSDDLRDERLDERPERLRDARQDLLAEVARAREVERLAARRRRTANWSTNCCGMPFATSRSGQLLRQRVGEERAGDRQPDRAADLLEERQARRGAADLSRLDVVLDERREQRERRADADARRRPSRATGSAARCRREGSSTGTGRPRG